MSWTRKVTHPSEMVDKGQEIECKVLSVDQQRRIVRAEQMQDDPWTADILIDTRLMMLFMERTKITNFVFCRPRRWARRAYFGIVCDKTQRNWFRWVTRLMKILRVDIEERKIGLSKKQVSDSENSAPKTSRRAIWLVT